MTLGRRIVAAIYTAHAGAMALLCVVLAALPVAMLPTCRLRRHAARLAARLCLFFIGVRLSVLASSRLPPGAAVVVANHASYLDGPVLFAALPPRFAFVIKREAAGVPIMGLLLTRLGHQFVDRFNRHRGAVDARRILRLAASGESVVFFPEGTFSPAAGLGRFHTGAFMTAVRAGAPVVPVAIRGTRSILRPGSMLLRPGSIEVEILEAVPAPQNEEGTAVSVRDSARMRILDAIGEPQSADLPDA